MVRVGEEAPDFELPDEDGVTIRLSDFKGKNIVLFFYPKDMSPGCTREACAFRDSIHEFNKLDTVVLGISRDPPEKHKIFRERYNLPYKLLSDIDGEVMKKYGVGKWLWIIPDRVTYVIDKEGIIRYIYKSQLFPTKHVEKALKFITELDSDIHR